MTQRSALWVPALLLVLLPAPSRFTPRLSTVAERVTANDNRVPAGRLVDGVLTLRLDVRRGEWFPQAADGPSVTVPVFAEEGKAPEVPGPLIRVPAGTILDITITNQLSDTGVTISGFGPRSAGGSDSVRIPAGASHHLRYRVDSAGTYLYRGRTETRPNRRGWSFEEGQLGGAIVVDPPGTSPADRIFVLNIWADPVAGRRDTTVPPRNVLAINGRSWPYTERQAMTVGDSVRWRVVNATDRDHPMHMHGLYYRIVAQGDISRDTILAPASQRLVVTESMVPESTMDIVFQPMEVGNWLFHCHLIYHVDPDAALTWPDGTPAAHDPGQHMAGLVLGLLVAPRPGFVDAARDGARQMRLVVREAPDWS
jgi:FtsP/CotA-like multicopper oxidase with cupredoxin domain